MDLRERKSLPEEDMSDNKKCCTDCNTTKTPLWRGGPAGPKSLCNACGIRYRKRRRAMTMMPLSDRPAKPAKKRERSNNTTTTNITTSTITSSTTNTDKGPNGNGSLKVRLMVFGNEVLLQRSSSSTIVKKERCQRRREVDEEEQAAFSLMALSCGSVSC